MSALNGNDSYYKSAVLECRDSQARTRTDSARRRIRSRTPYSAPEPARLTHQARDGALTSDHHFGHNNIIEYCKRPFTSVAQMNAAMIDSWNNTVAPDDTVYYLGDFAMQPRLVSEILPQLKGTKILIAGNHDRCHPQIGSAKRFLQSYLDAGFESIHTQIEIQIAGNQVLLHHFPYRTEIEPKQEYYGQRPVDNGGWLIQGHVHQLWKISGRQTNVSVENWDFQPVSLAAIAGIIEAGPLTREENTKAANASPG